MPANPITSERSELLLGCMSGASADVPLLADVVVAVALELEGGGFRLAAQKGCTHSCG